jgi:hypothetical protein
MSNSLRSGSPRTELIVEKNSLRGGEYRRKSFAKKIGDMGTEITFLLKD